MSDALLSPDWYRVATLRPALRAGLPAVRHRVRGEDWMVVTDPLSGAHHRFNAMAWRLIAGCDGQRTVDAVWSALLDAAGDAAPTQAEAIAILGRALSAQVLSAQVPADAAAAMRVTQRRQRRSRRQAIHPLAFRIPLWNPDAFLDRHARLAAVLFAPALTRCWLLLAGLSALMLLVQAPALAADAQRLLHEPRGLLLAWLAYPLVKALHELAHGLAVKAHGGSVRRMGITLMLLTPLPYVDASASAAFADKHARALVAAAGILVELLMAGLALAAWGLLEPSLARDAALSVALIGGLSTLLVNGNPLLRFDGYHVLCDLAELPNLAQRSRGHWLQLLQRWLFGLRGPGIGALARGERKWLLAYAPLAWLVRVLLLALLAHALSQAWPAASLVVVLAAVWLGLGGPLAKALAWLLRAPELAQRRGRALAVTGSGLTALVLLAFLAPLPQRSHAPAVVWLPDEAQVRLDEPGFVEAFTVRDGATVAAGAVVAQLSNPPLQAEAARVQAALQQAEVEHIALRDHDPRAAAQAGDRLRQLQAELAQLQQRLQALQVRARVAGRVAFDTHRDRVGMYLHQGHLLAQVLPDGAPLVRALVGHGDIGLVHGRTVQVHVALAGGGDPLPARLQAAVPQATAQLPSPALGTAAGGPIAVDPADASGRTAREPHFQVDLALQATARPPIGARALVTFDHGQATAVDWLARAARQAFLRHLPA